jgi:hypothetical protein
MISVTPGWIDDFAAHAVDEPVVSEVIGSLRELVSALSPHGKFPGPNPCSLERADLPKLRSGQWWFCEKTDGTRTLLYFTVINGIKAAFLVTRAWNVYVIGVRHVPRVLFQGSVFDGELVKIGDQWTWLGFDAITIAGVPVWAQPLSRRLRAAQRSMSAYSPDAHDAVTLRFKTYYPTIALYTAQPSIHPTDGLVMTPEHPPVVVGRHTTLFKLKDSGKHTVDFEFDAPDVLSVWDPKRGKVRVGKLTLSPFGTVPPPGSILEASYRDKDYWDLVTVRSDKDTSNDLLTYTKTMTNIRENMTLTEVTAYLQ